MGQTTFSPSPDGHSAEVVLPRIFRETNQNCLEREEGPLVVAKPSQSDRRPLLGFPSEQMFDKRCKRLGLGSPPKRSYHTGARGSWSIIEAQKSSNWRELKPIFLGLLYFQQAIKGQNVQVLSDNTTAVANVSKQGGTRSKDLLDLAMQLLTWAECNVASLTAIHLKGSQNLLAALLSRRKVVEVEWSLNQEVFLMVTGVWGYPQVDLFASKQNAKVLIFFTLHREDQARGLDPFAHPWDYPLCYAFPPFQLISLVLRKFREEATDLITPF